MYFRVSFAIRCWRLSAVATNSNYAEVGHMSACLKIFTKVLRQRKTWRLCWVLQETLVIWQLQVLNIFALTTGMPANASMEKLRVVKLVWEHHPRANSIFIVNYQSMRLYTITVSNTTVNKSGCQTPVHRVSQHKTILVIQTIRVD